MRWIYLFFLPLFVACSSNDKTVEQLETELKDLRLSNRQLMEQNLSLMQQMMYADSLKTQVSELKLTNEKIEISSEEISKLKEEVRLLMRLNAESLQENEKAVVNEDFKTFFERFIADSSFQVSRIEFPLNYIFEEYDSVLQRDTLSIARKDWEYQRFYLEMAKERTQIYDNYESVLKPNNLRMVHWYTLSENPSEANYYFHGKSGKWYLEKIEKFD